MDKEKLAEEYKRIQGLVEKLSQDPKIKLFKDKEDAEIGMVCTSCGAIHKENEWKSKKQLNGKWIEEFPNKKKHKGAFFHAQHH